MPGGRDVRNEGSRERTGHLGLEQTRQEGGSMSRLVALCSAAGLLVFAASVSNAHAEDSGRTLAVTMTNDPVSNQVRVYDASSKVLLQTLSTDGKGGVAGSAR